MALKRFICFTKKKKDLQMSLDPDIGEMGTPIKSGELIYLQETLSARNHR